MRFVTILITSRTMIADWPYGRCRKMKETRTRSFVKSLIWRAIALTVTYVTAWLFTGSIEESLMIALLANAVKTVLYYGLERGFQRVEWGHVESLDADNPIVV
jgi:uncharacterized membrane protein